jgi:hypothetical protein
LGLNNLITSSPHKQHVILVSNFHNVAIFVGEKMGKKSANSRKNVNNKKLSKI